MEEEHDRLHDDDPADRGTEHRHHPGIGLEVPTGQEGGEPGSEKQPDVHQQHRHHPPAETEHARAQPSAAGTEGGGGTGMGGGGRHGKPGRLRYPAGQSLP